MATRHRRLRILLVALAALSAADCRLPRASLPPRYWILTPLGPSRPMRASSARWASVRWSCPPT